MRHFSSHSHQVTTQIHNLSKGIVSDAAAWLTCLINDKIADWHARFILQLVVTEEEITMETSPTIVLMI
jgi:hypothetical protein